MSWNSEVVTRPSLIPKPGDDITIHVPEPRAAVPTPQDLPLEIIYDDADLAVINKEPGMVVHPGPGHPDGTLVNALLFHLEGLSGIGESCGRESFTDSTEGRRA